MSDRQTTIIGPFRFDTPSEWSVERMREYIQVLTRGRQPSYIESGGIPVINQKCIYWDGFHFTELRFTEDDGNWKAKNFPSKDSVLINSTGEGTVGRAQVYNSDVQRVIDSHVTNVLTDDRVSPYHLRYYLESELGQSLFQSMCVNGSTGQTELSKSQFKLLPIRVPPRAEQERIASVLYTVDKHVEALDQRHSDLQDLKHALMQDLLIGASRLGPDTPVHSKVCDSPHTYEVGEEIEERNTAGREPMDEDVPSDWSIQTIGDVSVEMKDGATPNRNKDDQYFGGDINWAVIKDVEYEMTDTEEKLTQDGLDSCSAKVWPEGSVIVTTGATIGKVGIAVEPTATKQGITGIIPDDSRVNNHYLARYLESKTKLLNRYSQGSTIKETRPFILRTINIPIPSVGEQERIASVLYTVDEMIAQTSELRDEYEQAKRGLMQDLLSGEVRTPNSLQPTHHVHATTQLRG